MPTNSTESNPRSQGSQFRELFKLVSVVGTIVVAGRGLHFLMHLLLGQLLGPTGYGTIHFAISVATIAAVLGGCGFHVSVVRFAAEFRAKQAWADLRGIAGFSLTIVLTGSVVFGSALAILSFGSAGTGTALLIAAAFVPPTAFALWRRNLMRGLDHVGTALLPRELLYPTGAMLGLLLLPGPGALAAALACLGALVLSELIGLRWLLAAWPGEAKRIRSRIRPRAWFGVSLPLLLTGLSRLGLDRWDILLLGSLAGMDTAGIYGAASRLSLLIALAMVIVNTATSPRITRAYHTAGPRGAKRVMLQSMLLSAAVAVPVFLIVFLAPELFTRLFGERFVEAAPVLRILAVGQLVNAIAGPVGAALIMTVHEKAFAAILLTATIANVVALIVVIPVWGMTGAAWATASTSVAMSSATLFVAWRRLGSPGR